MPDNGIKSDDVSSDYYDHRVTRSAANETVEMESWARSFGTADETQKAGGAPGFVDTYTPPEAPAPRELPKPKPITRQAEGDLGQPKPEDESTAGMVTRNLAEVFPSIFKGVNEAVVNSLNAIPGVEETINWLNENVSDLSIKYDQPKTVTGQLTKDTAQFLTGFIPALRGMKAVGVTKAGAAGMGAGAMADFLTRDPTAGRLSDLWDKAGLPKNILTDYMQTPPDHEKANEYEERFKNALEGSVLGAAAEGVFLVGKSVRGMMHAKGVKEAEIEMLKARYGEVETQAHKILGDLEKPAIEIRVHKPAPAIDKLRGASTATKDIPAQAVVPEELKQFKGVFSEKALANMQADIASDNAHIVMMSPDDFLALAKDRGNVKPEVSAVKRDSIKATMEPGRNQTGRIIMSDKFRSEDNMASYADTLSKIDPKTVPVEKVDPNKLRATQEFIDLATGGGGDPVVPGLADKPIVIRLKDGSMHILDGHHRVDDAIKNEKQIDVYVYGADKDIPSKYGVGGLDDYPALSVKDGKVTGHDGRHRMDVFKEKGMDKIPVRVTGDYAPGKVILSEGGDTSVALGREIPKPHAPAVQAADKEVYINFSRIDTTDDVKDVIGQMGKLMKSDIDEATRGKITMEETEKLADDLGMTVTDLLARRKGQTFNAEEALAARRLWAASGERLIEAARIAASPNAGAVDQFNFRKMMAVHAAIQAEVIGARTETARALNAWKIPAGGGVERARAIQQVMTAMGGPDASIQMAKRIAILAEVGARPGDIGKFAFKGYAAASVDAMREIFINGLLSGPKTHIVNMTSNTAVAFQSIMERAAAGGIRQVIGGEGVVPGEAAAMAFGMVESIKDSFRLAAKALKTGETSLAFNKVDILHPESISAEAFNISSQTGTGRFLDYLGKVVNIPGRLLGAEDEFFKSVGYRMELRAQALRQAYQEGKRNDELKSRVVELIQDPPEHIRINAADAALYNTFNNEVGRFGRAVMNLRNIDSPLNPMVLVMPFVRTPVNIARFAFERTPMAPLVGQWRADIAAGGARADLALARMATGTAIMTMALDWADSNIITGKGPSDPAAREALTRQGWKPYSFRVGDKYYDYNRLDPLGMTMGFAASIAETIKRGEIDENDVDQWYEVAAMTIGAVSQVAISKTYLEGLANVVEVISDPGRYTESYVKGLTASFLPATSLNATVKNIVDPVQRDAGTPMEAIEARIAVLSERLTPRRTLWGEEITNEGPYGAVYSATSPVAISQVKDSPIDKEIVRLNGGPQRISKATTFMGTSVNFRDFPKVYDEYVRLAGNELKHPAWGMGAKDYLNAVVSGKHPMSQVYQMMSDESKGDFIENTVRDFRRIAQHTIMQNPNNKAFAAYVNRLKEYEQQYKMPVGVQ